MIKIYGLFFVGYLVACQTYGQDSLGMPLQHASLEHHLKVSYDELTMELNINPFNAELRLNNLIDQLKLRFFTSDNFAIRLGFTVNTIDKDITTTNPYGTNPYNIVESKKSTLFGVNAGIEKHFSGTRRLSPYIGIEVVFANRSASHIINDGTTETTIEGAWRTESVVNNSFVYGYEQKAYVQYGANIIAGFDFYVARHFFIGYEAAYKFAYTDYKGVDITTVGTPFPQDNQDVEETEFAVSPSLINGIRVGYVF
jgi:hypothetical protein